jgi:hypothetical protein
VKQLKFGHGVRGSKQRVDLVVGGGLMRRDSRFMSLRSDRKRHSMEVGIQVVAIPEVVGMRMAIQPIQVIKEVVTEVVIMAVVMVAVIVAAVRAAMVVARVEVMEVVITAVVMEVVAMVVAKVVAMEEVIKDLADNHLDIKHHHQVEDLKASHQTKQATNPWRNDPYKAWASTQICLQYQTTR